MTFATEISDIQDNINNGIRELIEKTYKITNPNEASPTDYANITLIPPVTLMVQLIEMTMSSVGNILSTFQNLQIPVDPFFLLQQYVPYINWKKLKESGQKMNLQNNTKTGMAPQDPQGF